MFLRRLEITENRSREVNEATILSLVLHGVGVGFVNEKARWRRPEGVVA